MKTEIQYKDDTARVNYIYHLHSVPTNHSTDDSLRNTGCPRSSRVQLIRSFNQVCIIRIDHVNIYTSEGFHGRNFHFTFTDLTFI